MGDLVAYAIWDVEGDSVFVMNNANGPNNVFRIAADGSSPLEPVVGGPATLAPTSVGPDGTLFYYEVTEGAQRDLWALPPAGDPVQVLSTAANERAGMISPDGKFLAYVSSDGGRDEVYVQGWPDAAGRYKISTQGGREPVWRRDGREIFYWDRDRFYAVPVEVNGGAFRAGTPQLLFEQSFTRDQFDNAHYDVTSDGQRFVMIADTGTGIAPDVQLVVNWFTELERLVPVSRRD